ncbi:hypothetical protein OXX79_002897 [Metschnikowia pulcherrima]
MSTLIPSASACHSVQMPPIEKDDRLNLHVRTGSASTLHHSFVFTYGGLTIGLELEDKISIRDIETTFISKVAHNKSRRFAKYLSGEIFYLDLITKVWSRVSIPVDAPKPKPRLFHELATGNNCLYLFGGLTLLSDASEDDSFKLVPCNDLWEFNLLKKSWVLLHDGSDWENDSRIPSPRFAHKMTSITHLSFINKKDHFGLMIAGGHDSNSSPLFTNCVYDVVDKRYVDAGPPLAFPSVVLNGKPTAYFKTMNSEKQININYLNSVIVNFNEDPEFTGREPEAGVDPLKPVPGLEESLYIYSQTLPISADEVLSPLLSAKLGKTIKQPKPAFLHRKRNLRSRIATDNLLRRTVPHNLRYPTGGVFGQNIVIIGFLPNDYDISIFIYNKPTGKWSRLNIFCHHDYGSHRFWGGFAWTSHHKVVLLGNYVTSRTTSSVRYFSSLITVSLPVTNILASMEMAGQKPSAAPAKGDLEMSSVSDVDATTSGDEMSSSSLSQMSESDESTDNPPSRRFSSNSNKSEGQRSSTHNAATFNDYVHYAAPKVKFTKVRSVFPPAAITLGRNAFDRYGSIISDFEVISLSGDRIPVCMSILMARWGKFFIDLLARAYVRAVDQFENNQLKVDYHQKDRSSKSSSSSSSGSRSVKYRLSSNESSLSSPSQLGRHDHFNMHLGLSRPSQKETPQFRLPFQEKNLSESSVSRDMGSVDPHNQASDRRNSLASNTSGSSTMYSQLKDIPAQLPLPHEPIPDVPATPTSYRSNSRKNSTEIMSPRASLLHTLNVLRKIPSKSPRGSPLQSPRNSVSVSNMSSEGSSSSFEEKKHAFNPADAEKDGIKATPMTASSSVSPRAMSADLGKSPHINFMYEENKRLPWKTEEAPSGPEEKSEDFQSLLDFPEDKWETYKMEPTLIPRKLYVPFSTNSLKSFVEYLYTGQVGNKWLFRPCALDCLWMARYYKVPLLYDLLCEVLYGIIGRKEVTVIKEGKKYRRKFNELFEKTRSPMKSTFKFPLDEYEGFLDTVDDGYMDIALLRKSSNVHKLSTSSRSGKRGSSFSLSKVQELSSNSPEVKSGRMTSTEGVQKEGIAANKESTDDSTSASDEDAPPLHFLDFEKKSSSHAIRYKPVLENNQEPERIPAGPSEQQTEEEKLNLIGVTLEKLVSIDSPEPSDYVIDLIHEVASVCADVKLMLRSSNARQMSSALAQTKKDYLALEKHVGEELSQRKRMEEEKESADQSPPLSPKEYTGKVREVTRDDPKPTLSTKTSSTGSVTTLKSFLMNSKQKGDHIGTHQADTETQQSNAIGSAVPSKLTPVKEQAYNNVESNKKLDKQISSLIRKEEKLKTRAAKEEKINRQTSERVEKKRSGTLSSLSSTLSPASSFNDTESITGYRKIGEAAKPQTQVSSASMDKSSVPHPEKPRHGLLGRLGRMTKHNKKEDSGKSRTAPQLSRTESSASVVSSSSKKSENSKSIGHTSGGFLGLRKK